MAQWRRERHGEVSPETDYLYPKPGHGDFRNEDLIELANIMTSPQSLGHGVIPAGYAYLGQFVAHDISAVSRYIDDRAPEPNPGLDLDSIYGDGFWDDRAYLDRTSGKFITGVTLAGKPNDVPRDGQGLALIVDRRNDEHPFTSQLALLFMKLHNVLIDSYEGVRRNDPEVKYRQARTLTTLIYQNTLMSEFLRHVCHPSVYGEIVTRRKPFLLTDDTVRKVPLEFSVAAFRFGHSMVRASYRLGSRSNVVLPTLFALGGRFGVAGHRVLPDDRVIDWRDMFALDPDHSPNLANPIDPRVVSTLITDQRDPVSLAQMDLIRGNSVHLPTGQDLAHYIQQTAQASGSPINVQVFDRLDQFEQGEYFERFQGPHEAPKKKEMDLLQASGMYQRTPLWYYILAENSLARPRDAGAGECLGVLGSVIVAETIMKCIRIARTSLFAPPDKCNLAVACERLFGRSNAPEPESLTLTMLLARKTIQE